MWVPWRPGTTGRQQRVIQQRRAVKRGSRGIKTDKQARAETIKAHRKDLMKKRRKGQITAKEYQQALRKLR